MADIGHGATLTFSTLTANIFSISGPGLAADAVETTHMGTTNGWRTFMQGLCDAGEVSFEANFDPDEDDPINLTTSATLTVTWPIPSGLSSGATWAATAFCTGYEPSAPVDDRMTVSLTFKLSGEVTFVDAS